MLLSFLLKQTRKIKKVVRFRQTKPDGTLAEPSGLMEPLKCFTEPRLKSSDVCRHQRKKHKTKVRTNSLLLPNQAIITQGPHEILTKHLSP